jgi:hypothetical protein
MTQISGTIRKEYGGFASGPAPRACITDHFFISPGFNLFTAHPVTNNDLSTGSSKSPLRIQGMTCIMSGDDGLVEVNPVCIHRFGDKEVVVGGGLDPKHNKVVEVRGDVANKR